MAVHLCPVLEDSQFDNNGAFLVNGRILTRLAGTSTNYPTRTDSTGANSHTNPILLNTRGEPPNEIWLDDGIAYDLYLQDSNGNTIRTYENIRGVNDSSVSLDQWVASGSTPTYVNATTFTVPGDRTTDFHPGRRIRLSVTAGTVMGYIKSATYVTSTSIVVVLDSGTLDSGLSAVSLGVATSQNPSTPLLADTYPVVSGSGDPTKKVRLEVDGLTTDTTRVITVQDKDITLPGQDEINGGVQLGSKIQPVVASVATNALTVTINPTVLDFRNTTLTNGVPNTRKISAAISLTVPSGATLGTVNAVQARLAILAIDNAGTVEAAIVNLAGGNNLDESGLISTTALSASSNSANVIYSTTARASVPYRVVGYIDITEATAGTWATAPTVVQGMGGETFTSLGSLGYGQTWQDLTGSRSLNVTYYNTTGRPIQVHLRMASGGGLSYARISVSGITIDGTSASAGNPTTVSAIIPPGASYIYTDGNGGGGTISSIRELR